jgi:glycosyltransferase involved in cell wall biosynthesis
MKILYIVPERLPTHRPDISALFGKYLPRHGIECDIVGMTSEESVPDNSFSSVRRSSPVGGRVRRELSFLKLCALTLLRTNKKQYNAIQVRDMVSIGLFAMIVAKIKRLPFVYWMSYLMSEGRIERAEKRIAEGAGVREKLVLLKGKIERILLYRVLLPSASHIFVQSEAMKSLAVAVGMSPSKVTAVPMGVDTEVIVLPNTIGKTEYHLARAPVVAYLGTLDRTRCLDEVLAALAIVRVKYPLATLLLIGDATNPNDITRLLKFSEKIGVLTAVKITGWLPSDKAWQLLSTAHVAISFIPRGKILDSSSPTKVLEYLALALPCVANDNPDQVSVIQSSGAGLLAESFPLSMADAICSVLDDPLTAYKRASRGPEFIEKNRSYRVLSERLAHQYKSLIKKTS